MNVTSPPLTDQQSAALAARDTSVSLAAGAGCGKTFVLTERFISHVDPSQIDAAAVDELVAITFTDAAAREMRDRIRRRCYERLQEAVDEAESAAWQRLLRSMDAARISTIHAFCTSLLRAHAVEAGLDPRFEVLDAPAAELLKLEAIDDRLRTLLIEGNDDVLELAAKRRLERLRMDLANFAGSENRRLLDQWRNASPEQLVATWLDHYAQAVAPQAVAELFGGPEMGELQRLADPAFAASDALRERMARLGDVIRRSADDQSPALIQELRSLTKVNDVRAAKHWADAEHYPRFRDACQAVRSLIDGSVLLKPPKTDEMHEAAAQGLALVRLAADVADAIDQAKTRRNQLDFDDLLVRAHRLLVDPANDAIRQQAIRGTRLVMVDEFQDTNRLQLEIVAAFCGEDWRQRRLFAVGDFKQSIYRFNGADPSVSEELRAAVPAAGRLSLTGNFRSQASVLDFVNAVFVGAFANYEPLVAMRPQLTAPPAVEFLWSPGPEAQGDGDSPSDANAGQSRGKGRRRGATGDARAEEARWIARRLVQLLDSPGEIVVDAVSKTPRRLAPGDVAILLRALSDVQIYEQALREHGLDYYLTGGHAFYAQQEIYDVLNLLRAAASEVDEIALAGALRSPLFALADETLFWLASEHGSLNAGLAVEELPPALSAEESAKVRRAAATLARLRREKDRRLVAELLALALELTGYDAALLAEFLGPRKAANVEKLLEQARGLDAASPGDLAGFIMQLSDFVVRAPKEPLAATQCAGSNVIRIMTIHQAKGLEFPLVVLPDLERPPHFGQHDPVLDPRLGPLVPLSDRQGTIGYDLYRRAELAEDLEEGKRLLYVACTRASDYLILSSSIDDVHKPKQAWLRLVDAAVSLADGTLRATLPTGYGRPQVRIITERPPPPGEPGHTSRGVDLKRLLARTRELAPRAGDIPREAVAIPVDSAARRRFSFSQVSGELEPAQHAVDEDHPGAAKSDRRGGRELGSLVHAVLEQLDFRTPGDVRGLCEFLAEELAPTNPRRAAVEALPLIERFLRSKRARSLAAARCLRREIEFLLPWPPGAPASAGSASRYLQGYIDCLYQDADGCWRLLDYKTNRIDSGDVTPVARQYELQMLAYRLACEHALGEPLAECTLVLLDADDEYAYRWTADDDRQGVERITSAMDAVARNA